MPIDKDFKRKVNTALSDPNLRGALGKFGDVFPDARAKAYTGLDFQELRKELSKIKAYAAENKEQLAEEFTENISRRGAQVHFAEDGKKVVDILTDIAKRREAEICVKSKSMATEEIFLNQRMQDVMEMVETDLGEWIIQQVGEKPSHMVMPAIHLSKERCAEIFSQALQKKVEPDIPHMVKLARLTLRDKFMNSDIGISGCNAAVAENGSMVIYTNEGNARLTASVPPVHVIIMGYEKLVPRFKDIGLLTKMLPKSATAQNITSYVSIISGAVPTLKDKTGPEIEDKELHVIILDNGRKKLMEDPIFKEAAQCIRCASCLNVCPTYQLVGGHVYGHIYSGGIGVLLTAFFNSMKDADKPQEVCIGCGRCKEFCPGEIDIPGLISELRHRIRQEIPLPFMQNFVIGSVLRNKSLFHFGLRQGRWAQKPLVAETKEGYKFIRNLPFGFSQLTEFRSLPGLAPKPFRDIIKGMKQEVVNERGKIAFYGGCVIDYAYPEIGESLVRVLNKRGFRVEYPENQTCCGAPAKYMGRIDVVKDMAKQNLDSFRGEEEYAYVVSACPTCTATVTIDWYEYLKDDPEYKRKAEVISERTFDFVKLVHKLSSSGQGFDEESVAKHCDVACSEPIEVTYHDACHLNRTMGVKQEPRDVLQSLKHLQFKEMEESDRCCGFGGSYCVKLPEISKEMLERKLKNLENTSASVIAVDCPGCLMTFKGGLDVIKSNMKALHTAQILDGKY